MICCHISSQIKKRQNYIRRKVGKHFWVLSLSPRQENDGENDPSLSPAHLPKIPGKRIWQPHAHHQTPALTLYTHAHIWPRAYSHANTYTHKHTQKPQNPSPPAKSVCGHTLDTRTHSAGTKPNTQGNASCGSPSGPLDVCACAGEVTLNL